MKKRYLTEDKAEEFLVPYLPIAKHLLVQNLEEALQFVKTVKFPVVLKIISPQALHKSDIGGVEVVRNREELEEKYHKLFSIAKKKRFILNGILVQEYIEGQQLIIGIQNDATFGHVIMFGLGGIFVEVLKDVSFRVCPITYDDAQSMIDELKGKAILDGVRGQQPVNQRALIEALVTCSTIPDKHPELQELDINPFILNHRRGKVVDARITLG